MLTGAVANRYARALVSYAQEHGAVEDIGAQLGKIRAFLGASKELSQFLASPVVATESKIKALEGVLGEPLRADVARFLAILLDRGRGSYVALVADRYQELADALNGRVRVEIETAQPLTEADLDELVRRLTEACGKTVVAKVIENPALIAGVRIHMGHRVLDATTANALRQFRDSLLARAVRKEGIR
ncbi:ATP synthase F1 subunit delta [Alicyclobacillus acidocaldarius]|uniref:ATP synthase subunit delta n=1 Tax=Alicyclobacillus acidocaldarius (strain Tc-4-1) TaxID=1048834 RepID=F8ICX4_ALIAT|nr:ATP synthase F1 subunit delta [Alicyclobacillus acidocaldarius]AEJ44979.1 ATP synthase F1, delta subunit [Alicyclobacillus acidocaldarius subsp. acidocaldarius Tc-4-1]